MMEIHQLRCFLVVAEEGSLGRAATRLYVSTSAVSRRIKDLETRLQTPLFVRSAAGVVLTPAGAALVGPCRALVEKVDAIAVTVRRLTADHETDGGAVGGTVEGPVLDTDAAH